MPRYNASGASDSDPTIESAGHDIASRTKQSYLQDRTTGRPYTDASYAVDALKSSVADRMRAQGEAAGKK